jgi:hypothetical protein
MWARAGINELSPVDTIHMRSNVRPSPIVEAVMMVGSERLWRGCAWGSRSFHFFNGSISPLVLTESESFSRAVAIAPTEGRRLADVAEFE